ncbi:hypothetical protein EVAR_28256_1 [Eumeta japonica]|uniref:Uncharacterized protein n=1 Tax=Eumeta variegata TaxID=151549 RepID=A0A4C1V733_EUMVA|nr:hypothetical protein EVAR_28256_1 [Eumeta japonica]
MIGLSYFEPDDSTPIVGIADIADTPLRKESKPWIPDLGVLMTNKKSKSVSKCLQHVEGFEAQSPYELGWPTNVIVHILDCLPSVNFPEYGPKVTAHEFLVTPDLYLKSVLP